MKGQRKRQAMRYNLYLDAAHSLVWGDGTGSTAVHKAVGSGAEQTFKIYGRIPGRQNLTSDLYSDAVKVTVQF